MKLCRCPICHSDIHLEGLIEDEAGRELLVQISQLTHGVAKPMVAYLGLFKPQKSNLNNARALKILTDVLELYPCSLLLAQALTETVASIRKKRQQALQTGQKIEPLANHNYLKSVYETQKPHFAVIRTDKNQSEAVKAQQAEEKKTQDAILYVERFVQLGQEKFVKSSPEYQIWLQHKQQKQAL
ncbi:MULTISPECIES: hypothetical protein [Pasteurellaceae]|uniref:hypothetical protein n=1 Tax=Pasteurellaceae TaxID=712 RepID=UPI000E304B5A|nr:MULTISPECIES: hypothetical protein [Pasteurellaceae]AXN95986.1 hypothetical protein DYY62_09065 [Pasteurella multocida]AXN99789.1 hypothetical protein DYY61_08535 [Pasteurella multocida]AXO01998.1 hypothetical protein DYY63_08535 [Pasteurella multocida]AXO04218.1 hypothetical protein DYY64_08545 [Pasteurella multocida]MCW4600001.1 hypothetical protein [Pasteurella multocida subsp. multocida]